MEQSPYREANSHLAYQPILCLLWYPKVYYRVHKSWLLVTVLPKWSQSKCTHPISL